MSVESTGGRACARPGVRIEKNRVAGARAGAWLHGPTSGNGRALLFLWVCEKVGAHGDGVTGGRVPRGALRGLITFQGHH